jgi:hypothetical protein
MDGKNKRNPYEQQNKCQKQVGKSNLHWSQIRWSIAHESEEQLN